MTDEIFRGLKRRQFLQLTSGLIGSTLTGAAWAARPCPPPVLSVDGGSSVNTTCSPDQLPILTLTSAAASGTRPWTFGQVFKRGDMPAGSFITSNADATQADVRNRWSDGSVKYAVLSGRSTLQQGVPKAVAIATTTTAPSGANVAEPTTLDVVVTLTGGVTGTYTLQSCLGVDLSTWNRSNPGRVRQILGPVMSEFHYYCPTNDAHLTIWFYVRRYSSGETEVETVIENGWFKQASPASKAYGVDVRIGGASAYSASLTQYHHTRWSRVDWLGTNPSITPQHDKAYLRVSGMVPNYGYTNPSAAAFSGLASAINPTPFALGNWSSDMAATGEQQAIGVLPRWEALYCTTSVAADSKTAYQATISNVRGHGRWNIHYRDETTGRIPRHDSYLTDDLTTLPATSGGTGGVLDWDTAHHNSAGYLAYLIEGRWSFLEEQQNAACYTIFQLQPSDRNNKSGSTYKGVIDASYSSFTTRGKAWVMRTIGQAACISPTAIGGALPATADANVRGSLVVSLEATSAYSLDKYINGTRENLQNTRGITGLNDGDPYGSGKWKGRSWMQDFIVIVWGELSNAEIEGVTQSRWVQLRDFAYTWIVDRFGSGASPAFNFRRAAMYDAPLLLNYTGGQPDKGNGTLMTLAQTYSEHVSSQGLATLSANSGDTLKQQEGVPGSVPPSADIDMGIDASSDGTQNGYWAIALHALSLAKEHSKSGASAAWALASAAPNYRDNVAGQHTANDNPNFAVVPR
jgi:hypothetical protein